MKRQDDDTKKIIHPGIFVSENQESAAKPISMRGRSLSFSAPVSRDTYASLPESPATKYLAEFTFRDDFYDIPEFEEGMVINNYLIGQKIGGGVYSECREGYILDCKDSNIPDKVALKIITDPRYMSTFKKELQIWSKLNHPNILPLIDSFSGDGYLIAVSILAENGNLQSFISKNGKLSEEITFGLFKQILSAVHYLHEIENIVHLDIKLENILLRKNCEIYLCDFGMSVMAGNSAINEKLNTFDIDDQFCSGSVTSLPPEVLSSSNTSVNSSDQNSFDLKKKQDVWALGVTLYAMITGNLPFSDEFLPRLQYSIVTGEYKPLPDYVSSEVKSLISQLLLKNPDERPSIKDILKDPWVCK